MAEPMARTEDDWTRELFEELHVLAPHSPMNERLRRTMLEDWLVCCCNVSVVCWTGDTPRSEWLRLRRTGIGGSDRGAIRGVDRFKGRGAVYLEKRSEGPVDDSPDYVEGEASPRFWGSALEGGILRGFAKTHPGWLVVDVGATLRSARPGEEHLLVSVDALAMDELGELYVVDVKYPRREEGWWEYLDDADGEQVKAATLPESYQLQVEHGMLVLGPLFTRGMVVALVGHRDLIRTFRRDEGEIDVLRAEAADFWRAVQAPEIDTRFIDGHESTTEAVKVWVAGRPAKSVVELSDVAMDLAYQWENEKAEVKRLEGLAKRAKDDADATANQLRVLMGGAEAALFSDGSQLTNAEQGGSWGGRKDLSAAQQQEWEQTVRPRWMQQSRFRVLRYKARKGPKGKV